MRANKGQKERKREVGSGWDLIFNLLCCSFPPVKKKLSNKGTLQGITGPNYEIVWHLTPQVKQNEMK